MCLGSDTMRQINTVLFVQVLDMFSYVFVEIDVFLFQAISPFASGSTFLAYAELVTSLRVNVSLPLLYLGPEQLDLHHLP